MRKKSLGGMVPLLGMGALMLASGARAEVVVGSLEATTTGGMRAGSPVKVSLTGEKPVGVMKEPVYGNKPQYGTLTLGNAKNNTVYVVLDTAADSVRPRLYVDANGNGDLTDDAAVTLVPDVKPSKGSGARLTAVSGTKPVKPGDPQSGAASVVAHYNVPGRGAEVPATLLFTVRGTELTVDRGYGRTGTMRAGEQTYKIALVDEGVNGRFNDFRHEEGESKKITLLIDRNRDGVFDSKREAFDAAEAFRLAGANYEVADIDAKGTRVTLQVTTRPVKGALTPEDLAKGTEMIEFDAKLFGGGKVSFPSDYKKQLVLLDFWATWCGPCLEEMPNVLAVYNRYHDKGFDILGISLDKPNVGPMLADFLQQNRMPWPEVYDGKYWNAEVAKLYNIHSIPMSYLVDGRTGQIVAMGDELRGEGLQQAVEKVLGKQFGF